MEGRGSASATDATGAALTRFHRSGDELVVCGDRGRQRPLKTALGRDAFAVSFFSVINKQRGCVQKNAASLLLCRVS
ncbi:MAG: hypothetical protein EGP67_11670 [Bacteroidales bacterium]|nr:hypothetical protein [Bacteroidales bacterium]